MESATRFVFDRCRGSHFTPSANADSLPPCEGEKFEAHPTVPRMVCTCLCHFSEGNGATLLPA